MGRTYNAGPKVDREAPSAQVPGAWLESAEEEFAKDGNAVGPGRLSLEPISNLKFIPVETDRADVEHAEDGLRASVTSINF